MHCSSLLAVLLLVGHAYGDASAPTPAAAVPEAEGTAVTVNRSAEDWTSVFGCVFKADVSVCLQQRTMRAMKKWLESERVIKSKEDTALAKEEEEDDDEASPVKDKGILDQLGEIFNFGMSRFLQFVNDDDDDKTEDDDDKAEEDDEEKQEDDKEEEEEEGRSLVEEPRQLSYAVSSLGQTLLKELEGEMFRYFGVQGRRKKKIKKLKALVKILLVAKLLKEKILLVLAKLGFFLQVKFFVVAVINLLVNIGRLGFAWLKHKQPQKVIYYEHANHQHHYEHEHHHDYETQHDDKKLGWFGNLWSRSFGVDDTNRNTRPKITVLKPQSSYVQDYTVHSQQEYPEQYAQQDTAQYSPQYPPDYAPTQTEYPLTAQKSQQFGQDLAYSAQKPRYNRVEVQTNDDEY